MKIKNINKKIFNKITIAFPQNLETKFFLKKLNVKNINLIGNLKFAENYEENLIKLNKKLESEFNKKKIWVASSTHKNEEMMCKSSY